MTRADTHMSIEFLFIQGRDLAVSVVSLKVVAASGWLSV